MEPAFPTPASLLPHRPPHLLVSRVVSLGADTLVAEFDTVPDDVSGHFPGAPVIPGVWMIEGLAQSLACFARLTGMTGTAMLAGVERVRFRRPVVPPACLSYEVEVTDRRFGLTQAKGRVRVDGTVVCTAELSVFLAEG